MATPQTDPTTALLAPVPAETLRAVQEREGNAFVTSTLAAAEGAYHALVNYEPGSGYSERAVEAARKLSADCDAPVYLVCFVEDLERITTCRSGAVESDVRSRRCPDPTGFARKLGLGGIFAPDPPPPRSFMFVENATVDAVAGSIGAAVALGGGTLRLEPRGPNVLVWIEGKALGSFPGVVSAKLGVRVLHALDLPKSFAVIVNDRGTKGGTFETPSTYYSEGKASVDSILGETTREGILRAMGVDEARIEQADAPASRP